MGKLFKDKTSEKSAHEKTKELDELDEALVEKMDNSVDKEQELDDLQVCINEKSAYLDHLKKDIEDMERQRSIQNSMLQSINEKVNAAESKSNALKINMETLQKELELYRNDIKNAKEQKQALVDEIESLTENKAHEMMKRMENLIPLPNNFVDYEDIIDSNRALTRGYYKDLRELETNVNKVLEGKLNEALADIKSMLNTNTNDVCSKVRGVQQDFVGINSAKICRIAQSLQLVIYELTQNDYVQHKDYIEKLMCIYQDIKTNIILFNGIEVISPKLGDAFNPQLHAINNGERVTGNHISAVVCDGYIISGTQVLQAFVKVH